NVRQAGGGLVGSADYSRCCGYYISIDRTLEAQAAHIVTRPYHVARDPLRSPFEQCRRAFRRRVGRLNPGARLRQVPQFPEDLTGWSLDTGGARRAGALASAALDQERPNLGSEHAHVTMSEPTTSRSS